MNTATEKRRTPRMAAAYDVFMDYEGSIANCKSFNISPQGIGLLTDREISKGSQIGLSIILKDANINVQAKGVVHHSNINKNSEGDSVQFLTGIEFTQGHENAMPFLESDKKLSHHAVTQTVYIDADIDTCYRALSDVKRFPAWDSGLETSKVLESYPDGRARQVEFKRNFLLRKIGYTDEFSYDDENHSLSWKSVSSDKDLVSNTGGYAFKQLGPDKTSMTFHINITVAFIPSNRILNYFSSIAARKEMKNFKKYAEKKLENSTKPEYLNPR